jgi:dTDP-4-amino-4,6-dideoxy-D-galactose acyltransferase
MSGQEPVAPALESLAWDSELFGFAVGRINEEALDEPSLGRALEEARSRKVHLVYWPAARGRVAGESTLRDYAGAVVDRKVTYALEPIQDPGSDRADPDGRIRIGIPAPDAPAEPLLRLGVAAGLFSRFRVDPRMPAGTFERLYRTWMARSLSGEAADCVLVAACPGAEADPQGMVTLSRTATSALIGLIAVRDDARGRGVGSSLLRAAHRWMRSHGAARATVVTQLDNRPACRLYESAGYRLAELRNVHHFWPQHASPAGR